MNFKNFIYDGYYMLLILLKQFYDSFCKNGS